VSISGAGLPGGRGILTDDQGFFELLQLPAGRYNLSVSRPGFITLAYGQRRPLLPGTPIQLADGQEIRNVEVRLPRGSVVTGRVYDDTGEAMPGVTVRVLRYQYQQGEPRLTPAGTAQTDDLGQYRIWGLMPGEYYVDARSRRNLPFGSPPELRGRAAAPARPGTAFPGRIGALAAPADASLSGADGTEDENERAFAPTYFPGVTSVSEAQPLTLGLSQTMSGVDFGLQIVYVASVSGRVLNPDGSATTRGDVTLMPETSAVAGGRGRLGGSYDSRISWDGSFDISNVPPGRYILRARGRDAQWPQFATQPLTVAGSDIGDLTLTVAEGATVTGTVALATSQADPPDLGRARISSIAIEPGLTNSQARIEDDNTFKIVAIPAGSHLIRPTGQMEGWLLESVVLDGRDITDTPISLQGGQQVARVTVTLTGAVNEIIGTVTTTDGRPVPDYTVLAFSIDPTFWRPLSRHIATARPDQTGSYRIRGLPAGTYYVTTVDPTQQGEWYDAGYLEEHRFGAARVTLGAGETETQDFTVRIQ
jgi:hypothetical protein